MSRKIHRVTIRRSFFLILRRLLSFQQEYSNTKWLPTKIIVQKGDKPIFN